MFLSCERSTRKSLAGHLLKDGSQLEEGMQPTRKGRAWAINPGGLYYDQIAHEPDFRPWSRFMFVWGYLGLLWALIRLGLLNGDAWPKAMVPTLMASLLHAVKD